MQYYPEYLLHNAESHGAGDAMRREIQRMQADWQYRNSSKESIYQEAYNKVMRI